MSNGIKVVKRSGDIEPLNLDKIHLMVECACKDLAGVSASQVEMNSGIQFYDGISTDKIQEILVRSASDLVSLDHPNYQFVAARLLLFGLYKQVFGDDWKSGFPDVRVHLIEGISKCIYDQDLINKYSNEEWDKIDTFIDHGRDYLFTYAGLRQVADKYLVQDRSSGKSMRLHSMHTFLSLLQFLQTILRRLDWSMSENTTTQSASTGSTFPHLSWQECELHFDNLRAVFLLIVMTPSIASLAVTWLLVSMLLNAQESASTQVESVASTVRSEGRSCTHRCCSIPQKV